MRRGHGSTWGLSLWAPLMTLMAGAPGCGLGALIGGGIVASSNKGSSAKGVGAPLVDAVSPSSGSHGGGITITVLGAGFPTDASVTIGGVTAQDVVVASSGELRATLPRAPLVGPVAVVVINPAGGAGTLPDAFTYTNALPTAAVVDLPSPQSQNIVFSLTLSDAESDSLDLNIAVSTDGVTFTSLPSAQFLSGGLTGLSSSPSGVTHNITWDSRAQFPAQNAAAVRLRALPIDTTDGGVGTSGTSNPFEIVNNTAVRVELIQPGTDAFDVALAYRITDPDATDPVQVAALTWIDLMTGATGPVTVKSGQGLGAVGFASSGVTSTTVWRSLADLGLGNNKLVTVTVSVTDGTNTTNATSAPFFVSNGPLSDQRVFDTLADPEGFAIGDLLSAQRRLRLGPVVGGPFVTGELVIGTTSGAAATVRAVGTTFIDVTSETASFKLGETLIGGSSASATLLTIAPFPSLPDIVAGSSGGEAERGRLSLLTNVRGGFGAADVLDAPDLVGLPASPGAANPGPDPNPFLSGFAHPTEAAIMDVNSDSLVDLVVASSVYSAHATARPLLSNAPRVLGNAAADAPLFVNVIRHQVTLHALQRGGGLDLAAATYQSAQASILDRAPVFPPAAAPALTGFPSLDNIGWFVQDVVAAPLTALDAASSLGRQDLVLLHGVRQLGAALGAGDVRGCVVIRQVDPATGQLAAPHYLDPTNMGAIPTHCAVADVTSGAHAGAAFFGVAPVPAGTPDIVVANTAESSLTFYLQLHPAFDPGVNPFTGGTNEPAPTFLSVKVPFAPLGLPPGDLRGVAIADLNGDGANDLVVIGQLSRRAFVFVWDPGTTDASSLNVQTGGVLPFRLAGLFTLPEIQAQRPALHDVNGDGRADILVPSGLTNELLVYVNLGSAPAAPPASTTPTPLFGPSPPGGVPVRFTTSFQPFDVVVADLDGDRREDVAVVCGLSQDFSIFYQTAPGTLDRFVPIPTGIGPFLMDAGDVTGDGVADIAVSMNGDNRLQVYSPDATSLLRLTASYDLGLFSGATPRVPPQTPPAVVRPSLPFDCRITDLDGDGARDDVVVALELVLQASGAVGGWEGLLGGPLGADIAVVRTSTFAPIAFSADAGDVVGADGIPDVVLLTNQASPGGISIYPGLGGGAFSADVPMTRPVGSLTQARLIDLDGDGRLDIVCGTGSGADGIKVFFGDGTGIVPALPVTIDTSDAGLSVSVVVADVGGPLHPVTGVPMLDIVVSGFTSAEAGVLFQTAPRTFAGVQLTVGGQPAQVAVGDLDGDGRADIAIPWGKDDVVAVYYQNPTPTGLDDVLFGPATFRTANTPLGVAILDVDGDGRLDLVVSARGANALNVFLQR